MQKEEIMQTILANTGDQRQLKFFSNRKNGKWSFEERLHVKL
jgi:hypothetical protein